MATTGKNTAEVHVGGPKQAGYSFYAPLGSKRPTDGVAALDAAYIDLGYVSDEGINVKLDNSTDKILDWNLDTIAVIQKSNSASIEVTFDQVSAAVGKALFGAANVKVGTSGAVTAISYTGEVLPHAQFAFCLHDANGDGVLDIGDGQITGIDSITFKKTDVVSFKTTIELFKDSAGKFFNWYLGAASA